MTDITLESLIQDHKERIRLLKYKPSPKGCMGFGYYYYEDSEAYQRWLATAKRFIAEGGFPFEVKAVNNSMPPSINEAKKMEDIVKQAIADPNNLGVPQHFSYFDPVTNQVVTHYNRKE